VIEKSHVLKEENTTIFHRRNDEMQSAMMVAQSLSCLQQSEQAFPQLPPLEQTFESWFSRGESRRAEILHVREYMLGAATLPGSGLRLIYEIMSSQLEALQACEHLSSAFRRPLHQRLVRHIATKSASQTQAVLPTGVLVQKTVSLEIAGKLIVCSCLGDLKLQHQHVLDIGRMLALPRKAIDHATINPKTVDPVVAFGMVSPFFPPQRPIQVDALALIPWPRQWEDQEKEIAISLSLWESLLLPVRCLRTLLHCYAVVAYPHIPILELQREEKASHS
jgi:hypothetical protein